MVRPDLLCPDHLCIDRTQLDAARLELQALQVENRKLKEQLSGGPDKELELTQELVCVREENLRLAKELDEAATLHQQEMASQRLQQQQLTNEHSELAHQQQQALVAAEEEIKRLSEQLARQETTAELEQLRAVANETNKWEAREQRLVRQIDILQAQAVSNKSTPSGRHLTNVSNPVSGQVLFDNVTTPHHMSTPNYITLVVL